MGCSWWTLEPTGTPATSAPTTSAINVFKGATLLTIASEKRGIWDPIWAFLILFRSFLGPFFYDNLVLVQETGETGEGVLPVWRQVLPHHLEARSTPERMLLEKLQAAQHHSFLSGRPGVITTIMTWHSRDIHVTWRDIILLHSRETDVTWYYINVRDMTWHWGY